MLRRIRPPAVLALTQILVEGSAFLRNLILARLVGVEQMGLAIALALGIRVLEMTGDLGLERMLIQVRSSRLNRIRGTLHLIQAVKGGLLLGIAVIVARPLCSEIDPNLDPSIFILASTAYLIRGWVNLDYRERQRHQDFRATLVVEGVSNVVAMIAIVPFALTTGDYSALALSSILQAAMLCGMSHLLARRRMTFSFGADEFRKAMNFGIPVAVNGVLMFLALQGDRLIVAMHFSPGELARFAIAAQLTLLPALMGARFLLTLDLPDFSRLCDRPAERRAQFISRLRQIALAGTVMAILFALLGNSLTGALYGPDFVPPPMVMALLALAAALRLVRAVPNILLMSVGRTTAVLAGNVPRLVALPAALLLIAGGHGLVAVVAVGVVSEAAGLMIGLGLAAAVGGGTMPASSSLLETSR